MRGLRPRTWRSCHHCLDRFGDHWAACNRSGHLRRRAGPLEVAARRVLQEAGARVVPNMRLRDAGVHGLQRQDERAVEAVVFGLPIFNDLTPSVDVIISCAGKQIPRALSTCSSIFAKPQTRKHLLDTQR